MSTAPGTAEQDEVTTSAATPSTASPDRAPRWVPLVVAGLFVAGLVLRVLIGWRSGMWRDEAQMLFIVDEPSWGAMLDALRQHESHPPLYYVLTRAWLSITGDSDVAALVVPTALSSVLVPALYLVGARLLSWRIGLLAAAAATLSPVLVANGPMARPYSLLPLLTLAGTYALVRAVDLGGARRWTGYAVVMLAMVYTHNWSWLVVAAQWVALTVCLARGGSRSRRAVLRGWAGAQAGLAIGLLPWFPTFLHQSAHAGYGPLRVFGRGPWQAIAVVVGLPRLVVESTLTSSGGGRFAAATLLWALAVSVLGFVVHRSRRRDGRSVQPGPTSPAALPIIAVTPLAASAAAFALSPRTNLLTPYCLGMLTPLLLLLVATGLDRWRTASHVRLASAGAVALLAGYAVTLPLLYQEPRSNARELARSVGAAAAPSDLVVVTPWTLASSFNRYYTPPSEQIDFPADRRVGWIPYDDEPRRLGDPTAMAEAERRLAAARAGGRRVWLVTEGDPVTCPDAACEARVLASPNYVAVGELRAGQLHAYLGRLYGPPVRCESAGEVARLENLTACLFAPS